MTAHLRMGCAGDPTRLPPLPVLTAIKAAPLRFSTATPAVPLRGTLIRHTPFSAGLRGSQNFMLAMLDRIGLTALDTTPYNLVCGASVMSIQIRLLVPAAILAAATLGATAPAGAAKALKSADVTGSFVGEHGTKAHPAGDVTGHYDAATGVLAYSISYVGLTGPVIAAHIHGPTSPTRQDAPVVQPIAPPYASPISGRVTLTPHQAKDLGEGELYVNLHTTASPEGEARAKLVER